MARNSPVTDACTTFRASPVSAPSKPPLHLLPQQSYKDDNLWRETSAEKRELERLQWDGINDVRQAAEVRGPGPMRGVFEGRGVRPGGAAVGPASTACGRRQQWGRVVLRVWRCGGWQSAGGERKVGERRALRHGFVCNSTHITALWSPA